jgi:hypothetical protein
MRGITVTELELLDCFRAVPDLLDPEVPWCYNAVEYLVEVDGLTVSFTISPSYRDVRIEVRREGKLLIEVLAKDVADVRVLDEPGADALEVVVDERSCLRLQLRPSFELRQGFEGGA